MSLSGHNLVMAANPAAQPQTLSLRQQVAAAVRAQMAWHRVSGSALARKLEVPPGYISRRMTGEVALDIDDLERIAQALDVPISSLLPRLDSNQKPAVLRRPERHLRLVEQPALVPAQRHPLVTSH